MENSSVWSRAVTGRNWWIISCRSVETIQTVVVGLDFAFSMPQWFVLRCGTTSGAAFWKIVDRDGEEWLRHCEWPFWGRPGKKKPGDYEPFRTIERLVAMEQGSHAFSTFQIGGAGAVGTGSLRGMPFLSVLADHHWGIWPFTNGQGPTAIEIYPRTLTGPIRKSCRECRRLYLRARYPHLHREMHYVAASSEDAFDAAVSALVMLEYRDSLSGLEHGVSASDQIEGRIWVPPGVVSTVAINCGGH